MRTTGRAGDPGRHRAAGKRRQSAGPARQHQRQELCAGNSGRGRTAGEGVDRPGALGGHRPSADQQQESAQSGAGRRSDSRSLHESERCADGSVGRLVALWRSALHFVGVQHRQAQQPSGNGLWGKGFRKSRRRRASHSGRADRVMGHCRRRAAAGAACRHLDAAGEPAGAQG